MDYALNLLVYIISFTAITNCVEGLSAKSRQALQAKVLPTFLKCCDEFNFSMDELGELKRHKKNPESKNACFYACILKRTGILDDAGLLSEDNARATAKTMLTDENDLKNSQALMHECASVNDEPVTDGKKGCDRALLIVNCVLQKTEKYGLMP